MKWFLLFIALVLLFQPVRSQDDVFVLVDVSGNPLIQPQHTYLTTAERRQAVQFVSNLLTGTINPSAFPDWEPTNLDPKAQRMYQNPSTPILKQGSKVYLIPYGNHSRYLDFKEFTIQNPTIDISLIVNEMNSYRYNDQLTFEKLAVAKTVEIAKSKNLQKYLIFQISGLGGDQTASIPYTSTEQKMVADYESSTEISSLGSFRLNLPDKNYSISIKEFDISRLINPSSSTTPPSGSTTPPPLRNKLTITSPIGDKDKPFEFAPDETMLVSWRCTGCDANPTFSMRISGINGTDYGKSHTVVNSYSKRITLPKGDYKISISAQNMAASPVYVSINSGGNGAWLVFLLILIVIALAIYFGKNLLFRDHKSSQGKTKKDDDEFFEGKQPSSSGSGSSNDGEYF